ncbi:MAG: hypothetical protein QF816_04720 [Candidatus Scalindua sp.]|jgi:hypothetical protein|nr:hypothetical protein [Candidatus Scalindua sp.]
MAGLGKVKSVAAYGIEAYLLEIEVYVTKGQSCLQLWSLDCQMLLLRSAGTGRLLSGER